MKKIKLLVLALVCSAILFCRPTLPNADDRDVVISLTPENSIMLVNGVETEIDPGRETKPVLVNGEILIPIRAVIEALGGGVSWNAITNTVMLTMEGDTVKLKLGSLVAYCNDFVFQLDAAPTAIKERTMLPVRFIAESFNLGVAQDDSGVVYIVKNGFDEEEYSELTAMIPKYSGQPYVSINNNYPFFEEYEKIPASFEYYSKLDELGRCDTCMASVSEDIMPTGERESISSVEPTGWVNKPYDDVPGGYIYNRCHLIGYQLTGENANERNLITGTRYLNVDGMLPFEDMVDDYIEETGNHVMYRVTPVFSQNNLVADGVLMEAYSVEDNGAGVSYCVYCYNIQPGITINYINGENYRGTVTTVAQNKEIVVYRTPSGKKYHVKDGCGGANDYEVTLSEAKNAGLEPCKRCTK